MTHPPVPVPPESAPPAAAEVQAQTTPFAVPAVDDRPAAGRWRRAVPRLVAAVLLLAVLVPWWLVSHRDGIRLTARFAATVGIYRGSDVRILGVQVGTVDSVTPRGTYNDVAMTLDHGVRISARTGAVIISPNLVADRYVQLVNPYAAGPTMADGAVIPLDRTRSALELDDLYRSLLKLTDALGPRAGNAGGALTTLINTGAANLKGNGAAIHSTLVQLSAAVATLGDKRGQLATTIDNLASFSRMLQTNDSGLRTVNQELVSVTRTFADDRQSFGAALSELGTALTDVNTFIRDNRTALAGNIASLSRVAQSLARRRDSLVETLRSSPVLIQNFLKAYDPVHNVLRGRGDLNELTIWKASGSGTSAAAPPTLLPAANTPVARGGR